MKRRILFLILVLSIVIGCTVFFPATADANSTMTLSQLQTKFPNGWYWNHYVNNYNETGDMLIYYQDSRFGDTVTSNPCYSHSIADTGSYVGHFDCNFFKLGNRSGIQCMGFALKLASDAYNGYPYVNYVDTTDISTTVSVIKPGDVIHYYGYDADWSNGHWVFVIGVNGSTIQVGECNYGNTCQIRWGRSIDLYNLPSIELYQAPSALSTEHTHNYSTYVYYWKSHPHYNCYQCSCGEIKENRSETNFLEDCEECRNSLVTVKVGDVNGDNKINLADVTKVLQYIAKWELTGFNKDAADVNVDSKINLSDATKMLKYIAKWDNIILGSAG